MPSLFRCSTATPGRQLSSTAPAEKASTTPPPCFRQKGFEPFRTTQASAMTTAKKNQEAFIRDQVEVIVATIAFGMGIDRLAMLKYEGCCCAAAAALDAAEEDEDDEDAASVAPCCWFPIIDCNQVKRPPSTSCWRATTAGV